MSSRSQECDRAQRQADTARRELGDRFRCRAGPVTASPPITRRRSSANPLVKCTAGAARPGARGPAGSGSTRLSAASGRWARVHRLPGRRARGERRHHRTGEAHARHALVVRPAAGMTPGKTAERNGQWRAEHVHCCPDETVAWLLNNMY